MHRISSQQPRSLASTFLFIPDTVCHRLVRLLDDASHIRSGYSDLLIHEQAFLNLTLRQLTCPGIPGWYCTPDFDDGSRLTLDRSVAGQITITAYREGMASDRLILMPTHALWKNISNRLTHSNLIQEWRDWAATPAPREQRAVALERGTTCMTRGETELSLIRLGLTSLPDLPDSLTMLYVSENQLTSLPDLPDSLTTLDAGNNSLTHLPVLPPSLTSLYAWINLMTSLPDLPGSLTTLYAGSNRLTSLPVLPPSLTMLDATINQLTSLPVLPPSLTMLDASRNQLTSLPVLPPSLTTLDASHNQLTSLPVLPPSLTTLDVNENQLTSLPVLPPSLTTLEARHNQLISLPDLPDFLTGLDVSQNWLTTFPPLPASLQGQDVGFSRQRTVSSTLASAIIPWYPKERQGTVRNAWTPRAAEENTPSFTEFLKQLNENACAR
ncbi:TPA: leucine-rich repeat domain-containing protein [Escherichia coli]|nr:leucine-rich repeat domain-containing protein [Escherichia coli]